MRGLLASACVAGLALVIDPISLAARPDRTRIDSHWRDRDIVVDGSSADWPGALANLDASTPVAIGAANDREFLYLVLHASDPMARTRILRQGLIVWFDPAGKDRKQFGIKYPVGSGWPVDGPSGGRRGSRQGTPPASGSGEPPPLDVPNRMEIFGPKKDDIRSLVLEHVPGISVKLGQAEGALVYEMKIPLMKTAEFEYAIGAKPGTLIGIGLETQKIEEPEGEGRGRGIPGMGGMGGGGMGGRGGGMGGGGPRGGPGGEGLKPFKTWGLLQLAAK
jgi:hypothetical protein